MNMKQEDAVEIGGKQYLPSGRAAKLVGYTKDYVGQLARMGKLDAKLVGRGWYVTEDSIRAHKLDVHYELTKPKTRKERVDPVSSGDDEDINISIKNIDISATGTNRSGEIDTAKSSNDLDPGPLSVEELVINRPSQQVHSGQQVSSPRVSSAVDRPDTSNARSELMRARVEFEHLKPYATYRSAAGSSVPGEPVRLASRVRNTVRTDTYSRTDGVRPRTKAQAHNVTRSVSDGVMMTSGRGMVGGRNDRSSLGNDDVPSKNRGSGSALGVRLLLVAAVALAFLLTYLILAFFFGV